LALVRAFKMKKLKQKRGKKIIIAVIVWFKSDETLKTDPSQVCWGCINQ